MNRILNLSYMDLPRHLRACFLYLGIYPEDHVIGRDDLVRQWVAEGLVSNLHGQNLEDVGKTYFNQLINRNLMQPERTQYGEVLSCKVHDMMLDLVLSKCAEENFLSVAYSFKEARLHECKYNVRRLSLNSRAGGALEEDAVPATVASSLSQVRSLAWFGKSGFKCPVFPFKYLRVLFFDITCDRIGLDLTDIGQLCQLRYLKVLGPKSQAWFTEIKFPRSFEGFVHLETLEIDYILEVSIPSDIIRLPRLSHLIVPLDTRLPEGIGNMKSLLTLGWLDIRERSSEDIRALGELTNLRNLRLCNGARQVLPAAALDALVTLFGMLRDLRELCILRKIDDDDDRLAALSHIPLRLQVLELEGWAISRVPKWVGDLHCLCRLVLRVREITSADEVRALGELPDLVYLRLLVEHFDSPGEIRTTAAALVTLGTGLFPALEELHFCSPQEDASANLGFQAGTAPRLRRLHLEFHELNFGGATPTGMEHLLSLEKISVFREYSNHRPQVGRAIESAFREATQVHPSSPSFQMGGWMGLGHF